MVRRIAEGEPQPIGNLWFGRVLMLTGGKGIDTVYPPIISFPPDNGAVFFNMDGRIQEVRRGREVLVVDGKGRIVREGDTTIISRNNSEKPGNVDVAVIDRVYGIVSISRGIAS